MIAVFSLVWRVVCTFSFRMVFFYLVTTGWILTSVFYVFNQSNQSFDRTTSNNLNNATTQLKLFLTKHPTHMGTFSGNGQRVLFRQ